MWMSCSTFKSKINVSPISCVCLWKQISFHKQSDSGKTWLGAVGQLCVEVQQLSHSEILHRGNGAVTVADGLGGQRTRPSIWQPFQLRLCYQLKPLEFCWGWWSATSSFNYPSSFFLLSPLLIYSRFIFHAQAKRAKIASTASTTLWCDNSAEHMMIINQCPISKRHNRVRKQQPAVQR